MTIQDFTALVEQMRTGPVARRLIFVWRGRPDKLKAQLGDTDVHTCDMALAYSGREHPSLDHGKTIERYFQEKCKEYHALRNEPSALIVENAILFARYGCDMSSIFRYGVSPQSAVILLFPSELRKELPVRTDGWVKRNTAAIVTHVANQLGDAGCVVEI